MMFEDLGTYQDYLSDFYNKLDKKLSATELIIEVACSISSMVQNMTVETVRTMYKIFIERSATTGTACKEIFEMPFLFVELYKLGLKKGEFKETNPLSVAENIKTLLVGVTYEWCLYHPNYDFISRTKSLVSDYIKGLAK